MKYLHFTLLFILVAVAAVRPAQAQLGGSFGSSGGQAQTAAFDPGLPYCPPLVAGLPESTAPDGDPWAPGINCVLDAAPGQAGVGGASILPPNAVDPSLVGNTTVQDISPNTWNTGGFGTTADASGNQFGQTFSTLRGRAGVSYANWPDYLGADQGQEHLSLLLDFEMGPGGFLNNADGLGWRIITLDALESKLSLNWKGEQEHMDGTSGLNSVGNELHFEADLVLAGPAASYELEYSRPLSGYEGWTLTGAIVTEFPMPTGVLTTRLGLTHGSEYWMDSYYGITDAEAAASGLAAYSPNAGLRDLFLDATVDIPIDASMGIELRGGYKRLLGPAANAPQVDKAGSADDFTFGLSFYYRL